MQPDRWASVGDLHANLPLSGKKISCRWVKTQFFEERKIIALDIFLETYRNVGEIRRVERRPSFLMVDLLRPYFDIRTHFVLQQRAPTQRNETKQAQSEYFHTTFLVEIRIGWKNDCWKCVKYSHEEKKQRWG